LLYLYLIAEKIVEKPESGEWIFDSSKDIFVLSSSEPFKHPNRVINLAELDNRFAAKVRPEEADEELTEEQKIAMEKAKKIREEERERQRKIEEAR
jgi:hypothetical protein